MDVEDEIKPGLERNGFVHRENFLGLGRHKPAMRSIEGLLPRQFVADVNGMHGDLVQQAMYGSKEEQKSAKNALKRAYLEAFKETCQPTEEWFGEFYKVVKVINLALGNR